MELQLKRNYSTFHQGVGKKSTKWDYNKNGPKGHEQEVQDPLDIRDY